MMRDARNILLVVPDFPIPFKRKIHHDFFPIGLLKIGTYLKNAKGYEVELVFGNKESEWYPDEIWVTTLFTYWSEYVHDTLDYYSRHYPKARLRVGGIYATLMPDDIKKRVKARVHTGVYRSAEEWCRNHGIDYSFLDRDVDFQIVHGMRGCFRRCRFCGTWKIEPEEIFEKDIPSKIVKNHVIFYDNNFLRHPDIKSILLQLAQIRVNGKRVTFESQSGFDGRILNQELANLLRNARFKNPRIAWDNSLGDAHRIQEQIRMLVRAGYPSKDIFVFMLYNYEYDFRIMETKRLKCWEWGVQIADCRFRPLDQTYDRFNSRLHDQNSEDYYIHPHWSDEEIKKFRSNARKHNICVRHGFRFYSATLERMRLPKKRITELKNMSKSEVKRYLHDAWFPEEFHAPPTRQSRIEAFTSTNRLFHVAGESI